jgi:protein FRG1
MIDFFCPLVSREAVDTYSGEMPDSGIVSKKLKFKGDRPKKKKRSHREHDDDGDDLAVLAAGDPRGKRGQTDGSRDKSWTKPKLILLGWVFPEHVMEVTGPSFIILPSEPPTCLAVSIEIIRWRAGVDHIKWNPQRQQVYAAPIDMPETPEGANELSTSEILQSIEPTDVHHVWVISRLSGSESVISLRSSS